MFFLLFLEFGRVTVKRVSWRDHSGLTFLQSPMKNGKYCALVATKLRDPPAASPRRFSSVYTPPLLLTETCKDAHKDCNGDHEAKLQKRDWEIACSSLQDDLVASHV